MQPREQDMTDELRNRFQVMKAIAKEEGLEYGIAWMLNSVLRTKPEQDAYFSQGRNSLAITNAYRRIAGMAPIGEAENKNKVTWTMNSKHFADDTGKSRAFDFVVLKNGKLPTWDIKYDNDKDSVSDYKELAACAAKAGLEAGAYWEKSDYPHVQLPFGV